MQIPKMPPGSRAFTLKMLVLPMIAWAICSLLGLCSCSVAKPAQNSVAPDKTSVVKIVQKGNRFELIRNGEPYFINGAGGSRYMDTLVEAGGNSIRTWGSSKRALDRAHEKGLTVCMGLQMPKPRKGDDYRDTAMLVKNRERIRETVTKLKDHPALLMWGIGNEIEHHASRDEWILIWKEIGGLSEMIKEIDGNHPVITVIAGLGSRESESGKKLMDIEKYAPGLDAIGINIYGKLAEVPKQVKAQGWKKPYLVTEFGPRGWWEVDKTPWGLPIENTSTEKSLFYYKSYKAGIANKPNCLGSYVFLWGNKQEKTHTWFCLFLPDGTPTETIDAMSRAWTGKWPANRAPKIGAGKIAVTTPVIADHIYRVGEKITCAVDTSDPESDEITVRWDLRDDVSDNTSTGGDWEPLTKPIEGAVVSARGKTAQIQLPGSGGNYRVFVYVSDPSGKTATANLPIRVR